MLLFPALRAAGLTACFISAFFPSPSHGVAVSVHDNQPKSPDTRSLVPALQAGSIAAHSFLGAAGENSNNHEERMRAWRARAEELRQRRRLREEQQAARERQREAERQAEADMPVLESSAPLVGCLRDLAGNGRLNPHAICAAMENYEECGKLLQTVLSRGDFGGMKLQSISFLLHSGADTFKPCIATVVAPHLRLAALLERYFTRDCRLNVTADAYVRVLLKDIYAAADSDDVIRECSRSIQRRTTDGLATRILSHFEESPLQILMVRRFLYALNFILYQSVSGVLQYTVLSRILNAACRIKRLCRFALLQLMSRNIPDLSPAAGSAPPALGRGMRLYMTTLFRKEKERIASTVAALVSEWVVASYLRFYSDNAAD